MSAANIRRFREDDVPHLYDICLRTGDNGGDASATCSHERLLGDYYAVPYSVRDPELCLVLTDEIGPCGYVLGTDETTSFASWFNAAWLPKLRGAYADLRPSPAASDAWLVALLSRDFTPPACAHEFPAHLHIDLLPRIQGQGFGRALLAAWFELARARGAPGVHLGVNPRNARARAFYEHMGLRVLGSDGGALLYGIELATRAGPR
jgi:ribosomal protein S18 acetylase RimI-like enzyme